MKLQGIITALITPFRSDKPDYDAFTRLVRWQIDEGVNGLVVGGSTGESPNLDEDELKTLTLIALKEAAGKVPVIMGTGSNSTSKAIKLTHMAGDLGADAVMVVCPYYNKPTQQGLLEHFKAIAESTKLPVILYNVPGRTHVSIGDEVLSQLMKIPNIIGLKECTEDPNRVIVLRVLARKAGREDFLFFSGDDAWAFTFCIAGGNGCISAASNIVPRQLSQMQNFLRNGMIGEALAIHTTMLPLYDALFCETNPVAIKYAASLLNLVDAALRLPLVEPSEPNKARIADIMRKVGVL